MSARITLVALACGLLAAGCGTASGLQVENGGKTTPIVKPAGPQPRVDGLDAVAFATRSRGWAAGRGAIIATTDGGATWTQQYKGRADIRSLVFADDQHGWAVASDSLLRTADGGAAWSRAGEPKGLALTSVDFTSAEEGWGVAYPTGTFGEPALGTLVSTTDGGESWGVVKPGVADSICASGGELVVGAGSKVRDSTDGGATWTTLLDAGSSPVAQWYTATVQCPDLQSIWVLFEGGAAAGSKGYAAYTSADAGVGWQPVVVSPMLVGSDPAFAHVTPLDAYPGPFAAVSASEAIFLGQCPACDPQHVTVVRTKDGGERWGRRVVNGFFPTGLAFADRDHGWMTTLVGGVEGRRSAILATTDGGHSWHSVYPS
jgi:Photosynthesis system II assembly factor YCF48